MTLQSLLFVALQASIFLTVLTIGMKPEQVDESGRACRCFARVFAP